MKTLHLIWMAVRMCCSLEHAAYIDAVMHEQF
jgi:hypothetical protein